jgi:hypothetical protein
MTITPQNSRTLLYVFIGAAIVAMGLLAKFNSVGNSLQISFLIITAILTAILFYSSSYFDINYQKLNSQQNDLNYKNIRLALNFQGLGKLDAAFALYKQCKNTEKLIILLKNLAQDYEIIKQSDKADIVYVHIRNLQTDFDGASKKTMKIVEEKKPAIKISTDTSSSLFNERYEMIRNIGKGTGSTIFLARDHHNDKQAVAIKILEINYDEKKCTRDGVTRTFYARSRNRCLSSTQKHYCGD